MKIVGISQTKFGELYEYSIEELMSKAIEDALNDSKLKIRDIDAIVVANMIGGESSGYSHLGGVIAGILGVNIPIYRVEAACASGGVAINNAFNLIKSGNANNVLVLGIEKMTDHSTETVTKYLMQAADQKERDAKLTFPGLYALMASSYINQYGLTRDELSLVSSLMHRNALNNENAQFRKELDVKTISNSTMVAEPLRLLDCSPISDGAAVVIISNQESGIELLDSEIATDSAGLYNRESFTSIKSAKVASKKVLNRSKINIDEIGILEVHDCFSIALLIALEDLGVAEEGKGIEIIKKICDGSSNLLVNPSGGLKACGHPVGATGIKQIVEIVKQMRKNKNLKYGLAHNIGGSGGTATISIIKNNE